MSFLASILPRFRAPVNSSTYFSALKFERSFTRTMAEHKGLVAPEIQRLSASELEKKLQDGNSK